jgi:hypothetical protein
VDWHQTITSVLEQVAFGLGITLGLYGVAVANKFLKKLNLDVDSKRLAIEAQKYSKLQTIATSAVLQSEEHVEAMDAQPIDKSAAKLDHAVDVILAEVPDVSPEKAEALAKEAVARVGLGASGKAALAEKAGA